MKTEPHKKLAIQLAEFYSKVDGERGVIACACNAPICEEVTCCLFWEFMLKDPERLKKAVHLYKEEVDR